MQKTLIIGYGNPDRQDDGVAWHILSGVAQALGIPSPSSPEEEFTSNHGYPDLDFYLQITPELADTIKLYDRVCFIDAHTGNVPDDLHVEHLESKFQQSPFTHHMTPETCLSLTVALYGKKPEAILVSVRGYVFGFERSLSKQTYQLSKQAVDVIIKWLKE